MGFVLFIAFIVLVVPLAYFYGVDTRDPDERGWFAAPREHQR
jgi:hypothetical protein